MEILVVLLALSNLYLLVRTSHTSWAARQAFIHLHQHAQQHEARLRDLEAKQGASL